MGATRLGGTWCTSVVVSQVLHVLVVILVRLRLLLVCNRDISAAISDSIDITKKHMENEKIQIHSDMVL